MLLEILDLGARLSHVRAEVCKALRADAPCHEISALLVAEKIEAGKLKTALRAAAPGVTP